MLIQSNSPVPPELARHEASKFKPGQWCLPIDLFRNQDEIDRNSYGKIVTLVEFTSQTAMISRFQHKACDCKVKLHCEALANYSSSNVRRRPTFWSTNMRWNMWLLWIAGSVPDRPQRRNETLFTHWWTRNWSCSSSGATSNRQRENERRYWIHSYMAHGWQSMRYAENGCALHLRWLLSRILLWLYSILETGGLFGGQHCVIFGSQAVQWWRVGTVCL